MYLWLFGNTVNLASQCLAIQSIEDASQSRSHLQWLHSVPCPIATFTAQFKIKISRIFPGYTGIYVKNRVALHIFAFFTGPGNECIVCSIVVNVLYAA